MRACSPALLNLCAALFVKRQSRVAALFAVIAVSAGISSAQTPVLTQHNNNARTGAYTTETILTPGNVNSTTFGKLFAMPVDGRIYAQPLYVPNVTIAGKGVHNVLYVATEHDTVYAFDADSNGGANSAPLWQITLLDTAHGAAAGGTSVPNGDVSTADIVPEIGITSTPVIDLATNTIYVLGKTKEGVSTYVQRLHALDITSGAEKLGGPMVISASVPGTGNGTSGGVLNFDPKWQNNRAGLLLQNGVLYVGFGSHGDNGPWHGWILSYNSTNLHQIGAYCTTPNGLGSGIWMSGGGLAADVADSVNKPYGRMFVATGNGSFNAAPPYSNSMNYGDDLVRFDLSNGVITAQDSFTPSNQGSLNGADLDVASGGVVLLPNQATGGHTHLMAQTGKEGKIYLVDRDAMGGFDPATDHVVQEISGQTGGLWSIPAFWNNFLYTWGKTAHMQAFTLSGGLLSSFPSSSGSTLSNFPGATPAVSSNGNTNGIVWAVRTDNYNSLGNAILYAYNALNLATELYDSTQVNIPGGRNDSAGISTKFVTPTIANGHVYVGTANELDVYGLLAGSAPAATPVISPAGQSFTSQIVVTITDSTSGAKIYYTTDGSTPSVGSNLYTGAITVTGTTTVKAIASATGFLQSATASQTYTVANQVALPTFSPGSSSFSSPLAVTISDTTAGAKIFYTLDGTTPTTASTPYTAAITVSATTTIKAIAAATGMVNSVVGTATYTFAQGGGTGSNFVNGFSTATSMMTFNGSTGLDDTRLQLTSGLTGQAASAWFNSPVNVQGFTNDFTFQVTNAGADGFTFTIQNAGLTALGPAGGGLGYGPAAPGGTGGIAKSVAIKFDFFDNQGEGISSTGIYTNGASPTIPSVGMATSNVLIGSGHTFSAHMTYDGSKLTMTVTDGVSGANFTTSWTVNIPQVVGANTAFVGFTGGTGGQTSSQKIETWTYTPSTSSTPQAATPTFSPAAGTYASTQTVTLSDATASATIFYTIDGTTPGTAVGGSTAQYTGPLTVSASRTIKAIATATNFSASAVASATYTIQTQTAAPSFTPNGGTFTAAQSVSIVSATPGAMIYYTKDGTTPATMAGGSTAIYNAPITVSSTTTLKAIANASGLSTSSVSSATYAITASSGAINFANGFVSGGMIFNGSAALSGTRVRLTNGGQNEAASAWFGTPVATASFTTDFSFQVTGTAPTADGFAFVIQGNGTTALGPMGGGLGYGPDSAGSTNAASILKSVAIKFDLYSNSGESANSTGLYTNGTSPTTPYVDLTPSNIDLHSGHIFNAHVTYDGTNLAMSLVDATTAASFTNSWPINLPSIAGSTAYFGFTGGTGGLTATQDVISWTYSASGGASVAATPTFSPAAGTYSSSQNVVISDTTAGATIYYTTDGSTPTTGSTKYASAVAVTASKTLKAIATAANFSTSAVGTASYTIQGAAATPTFSPVGGTYATTQTVSISDTTAGAAIFYTTDGSTPTTASTKYTAPISVAGSLTVKAIATATGFANSAVANSSYTIQGEAATPTFSPAGGTYSGSQSVTLNDTTAGATIYYTTDGSTPSTASTKYTAAIPVTSTKTIKAIAVAAGFNNSAVASATYTINSAGSVNLSGGFTSTANLSLNGGAALSGTRLRITDSGTNEARSAFWTAPLNIQAFTTDFTFQQGLGADPVGDGFVFVLQNTSPIAIGSSGGGLGYGPDNPGGAPGVGHSIAIKFDLYDNQGEGSNSTGLYLNGASPTAPAIDMSSSGVNLHLSNLMRAHLIYDGTTLVLTISDTVTGAEFTNSWTIDVPGTIGSTTAYIGFAGGTGGVTAIQDIVAWKYVAGAPQTSVSYATTELAASSSGPTFRTFAFAGFPDGNGTILDATAVGDSVTFSVNVVKSGLYDVALTTKEATLRSTVSLAINGSTSGPIIDEYAPADAFGRFDFGNFNFATPGTYTFKFTVTGKNANSGGYLIAFDDIILAPQ